MRNVVLGMVRKTLQTLYPKVLLQCILLLLHSKVIVFIEVLQNISIFQKKHFKKRITQYFLPENKNPCFLVELSKQNLLQLNISKI